MPQVPSPNSLKPVGQLAGGAAFVGMGVPATDLGEGDFQPDIGFDQPGDLRQADAKTARRVALRSRRGFCCSSRLSSDMASKRLSAPKRSSRIRVIGVEFLQRFAEGFIAEAKLLDGRQR